jgi:hypothetical protein
MTRWVNCSPFSISIEIHGHATDILFYRQRRRGQVHHVRADGGASGRHGPPDPARVHGSGPQSARYFRYALFRKAPTCRQNLSVKEIDTDYWIQPLPEADPRPDQTNLRLPERFQPAGSFQRAADFRPGLEEYALLLAFEHVGSRIGHEAIVFDMAPTALTPAILLFTGRSRLVWLNELLKLRKSICEKKEIISKIKFGRKEFETDRVKEKLNALIQTHTHLKAHFMSTDTHVNLVVNNDRLSFSEALRIHKRLAGIPIDIARIVVNKIAPEETVDDIAQAFPRQRLSRLPLVPGGILGLPALQSFVAAYPEAFSETG